MRAFSPVAVAAALLSVTFAGCIGPALDPAAADVPVVPVPDARFDVMPGKSVWVESSADGARMHVRLFQPDTAPEPDWLKPTILVMSPYFGYDAREDPADPASRPTYFRYQWLIDHFVPRGFAVALADVRGTGDSGGCLEQTAALQSQDGFDIVEHLGTLNGSNGRVGMFGKSYDAETQQSTATLAPPHLTTIIPVSSVSGQYEYNFYDGVPFTAQQALSNGFYIVGDGVQPATSVDGLAQYPTRFGCNLDIARQTADRSGDWNAYWDAREIRNRAGDVEASVLYVHGLQDWNVKPVAVRDWFDRLDVPKRAILGQWAHDYPEENRFNPAWSRADWRTTVSDWYDHWLLGVDNGVMDALAPVQVQDSAGAWRAEATFPPVDAVPFELHLGPGKLNVAPPPAVEGEIIGYWRENDEGFVRAVTGAPVEDADSAPYEPVLVFESAPLSDALRVSGWPTLTFTAELVDGLFFYTPGDTIDAHFAANLFVVTGDGEEEWFNAGYLSARHRNGVSAPDLPPKGEAIAYDLRFAPADTFLPAGATVRLELSGSDRWTEPEGNGWASHLFSGTLRLPVVDRDLAVVGLDVPYGDPVAE